MILAVRRAYFRRRGWAAWHAAYLGRMPGEHFPELHDLTGERAAGYRTEQTPDEMLRHLRAWAKVTARRGNQEP